ncbi:MAG: response regulator transcription factor [Nitrospira sp.]|nr:response regulator transcription factor [Nitrospira sp.]
MRSVLKGVRDVSVVGETDNADDILVESRRTNPDVILLKYGMSKGTEVKLCKLLFDNLPTVRIIVITWNNDVSVFRDVVEMGAQGILLENISHEKLIQAIRAVAKGNCYLCQDGADKTLRLLRQYRDEFEARAGLKILSPQERRIISLIAAGNTNKEIATNLVLSEKTVKNYIASMFAKLAITSRTQAAALYLQADHHHVLEIT